MDKSDGVGDKQGSGDGVDGKVNKKLVVGTLIFEVTNKVLA